MAKQKIGKELSEKFAEYLTLRDVAKDATNAVNRGKTVLKNVFKDGIKNSQFVIGTYVLHGGYRFDYSQTESEVIETNDFLTLYESGQITRDQFIKCVSVQKGSVDTYIGSDVTLRLVKNRIGKEFDVRITQLDIDSANESVIVVPEAEQPIIRKKLFARNTKTTAPAKTLVRRINVKTKK